jgi:dihydrodipicolinate synthase/N-acetylneuraminate lyase
MHAPAAAPDRRSLLQQLFPQGPPRLWCPLITHYTADGNLDAARVSAHLAHLAPHVDGFLIPGSTGDGWEMNEAEIRSLLEIVLAEAQRRPFHLLIGVLKTDADGARRMIGETVTWLQQRTGQAEPLAALRAARVCGFTVCPPKGRDLSQEQITAALASILDLGLPVSLYQLPQVTQNEMTPGTVAALAARHPNFILFKDTSGADRVATSGVDLGGVFLVRGAEGGYARWPRTGGGPYDGFLLSTANSLARELHELLTLLEQGRREEAGRLSGRLETVVQEVFGLVAGLPDGNAFANANKAMDHFFAHGPGAATLPPPRLHAGSRLPAAVIQKTGEALQRHGFLPARGYLT